MIKNIDIFEKAPIPKAVFKLAVPTVLSMIVAVLYNMVDAFFVGKTNDPSMFAVSLSLLPTAVLSQPCQ